MKREFLQSFKVGDQTLPKEIIDAIMEKNGQDIQLARQSAQEWEDKYNRAVRDHAEKIQTLQLQTALQTAVTKAGGRNLKAIAALLDLEDLQKQENVPDSLDRAMADLKQEHGYLFEAPTPPPYARSANNAGTIPAAPVTLAGALKERMRG